MVSKERGLQQVIMLKQQGLLLQHEQATIIFDDNQRLENVDRLYTVS